MGHEIGHVIGKHSAERIAESKTWELFTMGASVGADAGGVVGNIGRNTLLKNGRGDELEVMILVFYLWFNLVITLMK